MLRLLLLLALAHASSTAVAASLFNPARGNLPGAGASGSTMTSWQGSLYVSAGQPVACGPSSSGYLSASADGGQTWQNYSVDPANDWAAGGLVTWQDALYSISGTRCNIGYTPFVFKATFPSQGSMAWVATSQTQQPWSGRMNFGRVVKQYPSPAVFMFGGETDAGVFNPYIKNDVWMSTSANLSVWTRKSDAQWPPMTRFAYALTQTERVVICGGWNPQIGVSYNTVWLSDISLSSWTSLSSSSTSWSWRYGANLVLSGNSLFLMGGYYKPQQNSSTYYYANDVWVSNDEGSNWLLVTSSGGFSPRTQAAAIATGNLIVLAGGITNTTRVNDVWTVYV